MSEIYLAPMPAFMPVQDTQAKMAEQFISRSPITANLIESQATESATGSNWLFTPGSTDALAIIDRILSQYIIGQTDIAEAMANEIALQSEAIAEINRLWGLIMTDRLPHTKPGDNQTTPLNGGSSREYLQEIDDIIKNDLGNPEGINVIVGAGGMGQNVTYDQLQSMNATMTAYCDTIQVDLDTEQQLFKNVMTSITSAQDEIRDVRRAIVSIAQTG